MSQFTYDPNPHKKQNYRDSNIVEDRLHLWTQENLYRTSYANSYTDKPQEPKNSITPGYQGFVPGFKSRAQFGRSFAQIAKDCFNHPELGQNKFNLSSTGFNLDKKVLIDETLTASTHKYGAPTQQRIHPSLQPTEYISHTHSTFQNPTSRIPPTYRPSEVSCLNPKAKTKASGYATNSVTFDGKGLLPKETDNLARTVTEYRNRFNTEKPIHRTTTIHHPRSLDPFSNEYNVNQTK